MKEIKKSLYGHFEAESIVVVVATATPIQVAHIQTKMTRQAAFEGPPLGREDPRAADGLQDGIGFQGRANRCRRRRVGSQANADNIKFLYVCRTTEALERFYPEMGEK
jgi:hypothetical protein